MFSRKSSKDSTQAKDTEPTSAAPRPATPSAAEEKSEKRRSRSNSLKSMFNSAKKTSADAQEEEPPRPAPLEDHDPPKFVDDKDILKSLPALSKLVFLDDFAKFKDAIAKKKVDLTPVDKMYNRNVFHWISVRGTAKFATALFDRFKTSETETLTTAVDIEGRTPMTLAVTNRRIDVLRALLNENAFSINSPDKFGKTPLQYSVRGDDLTCCTILILRGANANIVNESGETLLMEAIKQEKFDASSALINNHAKLDLKDRAGRNALHYATEAKSQKLVQLLLEKGCTVEKDSQGRTPVDLTTGKPEMASIKKLLEESSQPSLAKWDSTMSSTSDIVVNENGQQKGLGKGLTDMKSIPDIPDEEDNDNSSGEFLRGGTDEEDASNSKKSLNNSSQTPLKLPIVSISIEGEESRSQTLPRFSVPKLNTPATSLTLPRSSMKPDQLGVNSEMAAKPGDFDDFQQAVREHTTINPLSRRPSVANSSEPRINEPLIDNLSAEDLPSPKNANGEYFHHNKSSRDNSGDELFGSKGSNELAITGSRLSLLDGTREIVVQLSQVIPLMTTFQLELGDIDSTSFDFLVQHILRVKAALDAEIEEAGPPAASIEQLTGNYERNMAALTKELESAKEKVQAFAAKELAWKQQEIGFKAREQAFKAQEAALKSTLEQSKKHSDSLPNEGKEKYEVKIAQLSEQLSTVTKQLNDKDLQILDLESEIDDEKEQLGRVIEEHNRALRQYNELRSQLDSFSERSAEEITSLQARLAEEQGRNSDSTSSSLRLEVKMKDEDIVRLKRDLLKTQSQLEECERQLDAVNDNNDKLQRIKNTVEKKESTHLALQLRGKKYLEPEGNSISSSLSDIGEEQFSSKEQLYSELSAELDATSNRLISEMARRKEFQEELNSVKPQLLKVSTENSSFVQQIEAHKKQVADLLNARSSLELQLHRLLDDIDSKDTEIESERLISDQLREKLKDQETLLSKLQTDMKALLEARKNSEQNIGQSRHINADIKRLTLALKEKEAEIAELKQDFHLDNHIDVLQERLQKERMLRVENENALLAINGILEQLQTEFCSINEMEINVQKDIVESKKLRADLDDLLVESTGSATSSIAIIDELGKLSSNLKLRLKALEDKELLLLQNQSSQEAKQKSLQHDIETAAIQFAKLREEKSSLEKQVLEIQTKDKDEVKAINRKVKDLTVEVELKTAELDKSQRDLEHLRAENAKISAKVQMDLSKHNQQLNEMKERNSKVTSELQFEIEDARQQLEESAQALAEMQSKKTEMQRELEMEKKELASLKDELLQKDTTIDILQATISEQDGFKPDLIKAKEGIQALQSKIAKLTAEVAEKRSTIDVLENEQAEMDSEREKMLAESLMMKGRLEDESKFRRRIEDDVVQICRKIDELCNKPSDTTMNVSVHRQSTSRGGNVASLLEELDELHNGPDRLNSLILAQQEQWHIWSTQFTQESPAYAIVKKCISAFSASTENGLGRRIAALNSNICSKSARLIAEAQNALKLSEQQAALREIERQAQQKEGTSHLIASKAALEDKIVEYRSMLAGNDTRFNDLQSRAENEVRSLKIDIEKLRSEVMSREASIVDLRHQAGRVGEYELRYQELKAKTSKLENQLRESMMESQKTHMDMMYLKSELQDRDPDFIAEFERLQEAEQSAMETKLHARMRSAETAVVDGDIMGDFVPPLASFSNKYRRLSTAKKSEKANVLTSLVLKIESLEREYKEAQLGWQQNKQELVKNHEEERILLSKQLDEHNHALDRLQVAMKEMANEAKGQAEESMLYLLDSLIDRLDELQEDREQLEEMRKGNERMIINSYEDQLRTALHDMDIMRYQLEQVTVRTRGHTSMISRTSRISHPPMQTHKIHTQKT